MLRDQENELKTLLLQLTEEYGCVGLKMSTEDAGNSLDYIDYVTNRLLNHSIPLHMKIGGPDAQNDIQEALRIGVSGLIGPMVESPFGVSKFVAAVKKVIGEQALKQVLLSINLESLSAYHQIDEILATPELSYVDQIVIGTSDLARSVARANDDDDVLRMVREMAQQAKKLEKRVRIGGVISLSHGHMNLLTTLLRDTNADNINTANVIFSVPRLHDLSSAYLLALTFEKKLYSHWAAIHDENLARLRRRVSSLEHTIAQAR
jgi:hypothetical protein